MIIDPTPDVLEAANAAAKTHLVSGGRGGGRRRRAGWRTRRQGAQAPSPSHVLLQGLTDGLQTKGLWTAEMMETLHRWVGGGVTLIWQHHLDLVSIPPGKPHAVANLQPNVKCAMDGLLLRECPACVQSMRDVRHLVPPNDVADYGFLASRMLSLLVQGYYNGPWKTM